MNDTSILNDLLKLLIVINSNSFGFEFQKEFEIRSS